MQVDGGRSCIVTGGLVEWYWCIGYRLRLLDLFYWFCFDRGPGYAGYCCKQKETKLASWIHGSVSLLVTMVAPVVFLTCITITLSWWDHVREKGFFQVTIGTSFYQVTGRGLHKRDHLWMFSSDNPGWSRDDRFFWIWRLGLFFTWKQEGDRELVFLSGLERMCIIIGVLFFNHMISKDAIYKDIFIQGFVWYRIETLYICVLVSHITGLLVFFYMNMVHAHFMVSFRVKILIHYVYGEADMRFMWERLMFNPTGSVNSSGFLSVIARILSVISSR